LPNGAYREPWRGWTWRTLQLDGRVEAQVGMTRRVFDPTLYAAHRCPTLSLRDGIASTVALPIRERHVCRERNNVLGSNPRLWTPPPR